MTLSNPNSTSLTDRETASSQQREHDDMGYQHPIPHLLLPLHVLEPWVSI